VTPSCLNTPSGANFSPTVTPCNSPTGSSSPTGHHHNEDHETSLTSFLTSSAGILRKKITGHDPERSVKAANILEKKAKIRLIRSLERVDNLGIENILIPSSSSRMVSPLALHNSNIYTRYNSPMTQLTSLKHLSEKKKTPEALSNDSTDQSETPSTSVASNSNQARIKQRVHRQRSRLNMNGTGQRSDLGTVNVNKNIEPISEKSLVGGFVGSISSMFFGRKGGLL